VDDVYQELKPLMFSIAYRMLGSATEAEDIVQEAFLRFHKETSGGIEVDSAMAYLSAVTTRLSIDHLRSARVRRERYVGHVAPRADPDRGGGRRRPPPRPPTRSR
jgi:RNA polymerase sigma-70 factor, ECF subfamily